ncbi:MAG: hypothetical protein U1A78_11425 [Polyangia bacterium]
MSVPELLLARLPLAAPCWPLLLLLVLPLLSAGLGASGIRPRALLGLTLGLLGLDGALLLGLEAHRPLVLGLSLGRYLQVETLRIEGLLVLGRGAAAALLGLTGLTGLVLRREPALARPLLGLLGATTLALLADDVLLRALGWVGVTLSLGTATRRLAPLLLGHLADGALLLWAVLGFWSLGGSFAVGHSPLRFVPDEDPARPLPRLVVQHDGSPKTTELTVGPTLSLREARAQLMARTPSGARPLRERLANKLFLGARLQAVLGALLALASLLRIASGLAAAWAVRRSPRAGLASGLLAGLLCSLTALAVALAVWAELGLW